MGCGSSVQSPSVPAAAAGSPRVDPLTKSRRTSLENHGSSIREMRKIEFGRLMDDDEGFKALLDFAKSEFSEENMLFWMDVMRFKRTAASSKAATWDAEMAVKAGEATEADVESRRAEGLLSMTAAASKIIDTYLRDGAEMQLSLPDHPFRKRASEALAPAGTVAVEKVMFDKATKMTYKNIEHDTFKRFKLSDAAQQLALRRSYLCTDAASAEGDEHDNHRQSQKELRAILDALQLEIGFERATVWLYEPTGRCLWSIQSTELGNSMICMRADRGLVGKAVSMGGDLLCADAYQDAAFSDRVDKATGYRTRSVMCVTLKHTEGQVRGVVQLINKRALDPTEGGEGPDPAAAPQCVEFVEADCQAVHARDKQITETLNAVPTFRYCEFM